MNGREEKESVGAHHPFGMQAVIALSPASNAGKCHSGQNTWKSGNRREVCDACSGECKCPHLCGVCLVVLERSARTGAGELVAVPGFMTYPPRHFEEASTTAARPHVTEKSDEKTPLTPRPSIPPSLSNPPTYYYLLAVLYSSQCVCRSISFLSSTHPSSPSNVARPLFNC